MEGIKADRRMVETVHLFSKLSRAGAWGEGEPISLNYEGPIG